MVKYNCPVTGCAFQTEDVEAAAVTNLLLLHNNDHRNPPAAVRQKPPKIDRPKVSKGCSEEVWRAFDTRWKLFKDGTQLTPEETNRQLFQCCHEDLGN